MWTLEADGIHILQCGRLDYLRPASQPCPCRGGTPFLFLVVCPRMRKMAWSLRGPSEGRSNVCCLCVGHAGGAGAVRADPSQWTASLGVQDVR